MRFHGPMLSLVFADRSLLGDDYDDANCISQIVEVYFSDGVFLKYCQVYFSDLASCTYFSNNALFGLFGLC